MLYYDKIEREEVKMICIDIDSLTECLVEASTGRTVKTYVKRIQRKADLKGFTKKDWYVNWSDLFNENEIYAVYAEGDPDVQGLVAIAPKQAQKSMYIAWAVSAPCNNLEKSSTKKYIGVGGHLLSIAAKRSIEEGFEGDMFGFAKDAETCKKFINKHYACFIGALHDYHIEFFENISKHLMEVYDYDIIIG